MHEVKAIAIKGNTFDNFVKTSGTLYRREKQERTECGDHTVGYAETPRKFQVGKGLWHTGSCL